MNGSPYHPTDRTTQTQTHTHRHSHGRAEQSTEGAHPHHRVGKCVGDEFVESPREERVDAFVCRRGRYSPLTQQRPSRGLHHVRTRELELIGAHTQTARQRERDSDTDRERERHTHTETQSTIKRSTRRQHSESTVKEMRNKTNHCAHQCSAVQCSAVQ